MRQATDAAPVFGAVAFDVPAAELVSCLTLLGPVGRILGRTGLAQVIGTVRAAFNVVNEAEVRFYGCLPKWSAPEAFSVSLAERRP
jgi:hypothetical protein